MSDDHRLVYSTDPALKQKCPRCHELMAACVCVAEAAVPKSGVTAVLRLEKKGRGGKAVTVVDRLPKNETYLKNLAALLKKKCGSGGTFLMDGADGVIEIQGDKRDLIRQILAQENIRTKG